MKNIFISGSKKLVLILIPLSLLFLAIFLIAPKGIPLTPPTPELKYNDIKINLSQGEYNWFNKDHGGNSFLAGSSYDVGEKMKCITTKPEDKIAFNFGEKPKTIKVLLWTDYNRAIVYKSYGTDDVKEIITPKAEGEYVMEIVGEWDETHNTSHIFKIKVTASNGICLK